MTAKEIAYHLFHRFYTVDTSDPEGRRAADLIMEFMEKEVTSTLSQELEKERARIRGNLKEISWSDWDEWGKVNYEIPEAVQEEIMTKGCEE